MPIEITMPRLSDTMETGTIIKWNVQEGDTVAAGDVVADVETDKATMEMQVYDDGTIAKILVGEGQTVDIGTLIAVLAEEDEDPSSIAGDAGASSASAATVGVGSNDASDTTTTTSATAVAEPPPKLAPSSSTPRRSGGPRVSPVARQLAEDHDLDLGRIEGSGPSGRIIKRDVLQAIDASRETVASVPPAAIAPVERTASVAQPVAPAYAGEESGLQGQIVPLSNMRQVIARRLVESKTTIPHYQVTVTFDMDPLLDFRKTLNEQLAHQGVKLSVNDFLIRGCAMAMYQHPEFNSSFQGDSIEIHGEINIGVAVALPAERGGGLVVASIRQADRKSLRQLGAEVRHLAEKARTRGLSPEDMSDTTFTLSNLGMFGVEHFTAIINPPNTAILAVGAALQKPVVRDGELTVGHEMSATLSLDHRVIDGAMGAQYLQTLKQMIEHPSTLLV